MKNKQFKVLIVLIAIIIILGTQEMKTTKKTTGETVTITSNSPIMTDGQLSLTFTLSSQTDVNLWKVKAVDTVTSGWAFYDRYFTGASGPQHNEICSMEADGYYCTMLAEAGSTVAETVTIVYDAPITPGDSTFTGGWETYYQGALQNDVSFSEPVTVQSPACVDVSDCDAPTDLECRTVACVDSSCEYNDINQGGSCTTTGGEEGACNGGVCEEIAATCYTCDDYGATHIDPECSDGPIEDNCGGFIDCGPCGMGWYCDYNLVCQFIPGECDTDFDCDDSNLCTTDTCDVVQGQCSYTARDGVSCTTGGNPGTCNSFGQCVEDTGPAVVECEFWEEENDEGNCTIAKWVIIVGVIFGALYALNIISR